MQRDSDTLADQATPPPGSSERERTLVSDRLCRIEDELGEVKAGVAELVAQGARREGREIELLRIEEQRRDRSADAESKRLEAELESRKAWGGWFREKVADRLISPLVLALGAIASAVAGWWAGGGAE